MCFAARTEDALHEEERFSVRGVTPFSPDRTVVAEGSDRLAGLQAGRRRMPVWSRAGGTSPRLGLQTGVPQSVRPTSPPGPANAGDVPDVGASPDRVNELGKHPPNTASGVEQSPTLGRSSPRAAKCYKMREFCTDVKDDPELANCPISRICRRAERQRISHEFLIVEAGEYSIRLERRANFYYSRTSLTSSYTPVDEACFCNFSCIAADTLTLRNATLV